MKPLHHSKISKNYCSKSEDKEKRRKLSTDKMISKKKNISKEISAKRNLRINSKVIRLKNTVDWSLHLPTTPNANPIVSQNKTTKSLYKTWGETVSRLPSLARENQSLKTTYPHKTNEFKDLITKDPKATTPSLVQIRLWRAKILMRRSLRYKKKCKSIIRWKKILILTRKLTPK